MVTHVDHTEHDVQVIVTEQGLADLRGLSPNNAPPSSSTTARIPNFRPALQEYFRARSNFRPASTRRTSGRSVHLPAQLAGQSRRDDAWKEAALSRRMRGSEMKRGSDPEAADPAWIASRRCSSRNRHDEA